MRRYTPGSGRTTSMCPWHTFKTHGTPSRHRGACAHHPVAIKATGVGLMAMGGYITRLPGHGDHFGAAVAMDCSGAGNGGQI